MGREDQERGIVRACTQNGWTQHGFRHVGYVLMGTPRRWRKAYAMDCDGGGQLYARKKSGVMYRVRGSSVDLGGLTDFKSCAFSRKEGDQAMRADSDSRQNQQ